MVPLPRISRRAENFERHLSGRSEPAKGVTEWRLGERKKRCRLHKGTRWLLRRPNPECVGARYPACFYHQVSICTPHVHPWVLFT